ncbi:hypothetical protein [Meridianimarinicoccus sp. MJW13]|uniref:hypothetical protein n=1 Tax=Meridianimarinicoccus sp. MJW13 TaxID=2720031 RepID=UPI001865EAA7|nr:hypothetical protein [Fluviibacterium sp. MJW13]
MFKVCIICALSVGIAAPALANEQLARAADVAPGEYTTIEMIELAQVGGHEWQQRMDVIQKQRAAFDAEVRASMTRISTRSPDASVTTR